MKEQFVCSVNKKFGIRQLMFADVNALLKAGFAYKWGLDQALANKLHKMAGLVPNTTGFVSIMCMKTLR